MAALETPEATLGSPAIDFSLPGVDGTTYSFDDIKGERGTVVAFICNHCPYVKAVRSRLIRDARDLAAHGIAVVAINSNDAEAYPEDSFDAMVEIADQYAYPFPYLFDESQAVAKAYGAVCTPDFFGYDGDGKLRYRGRLDATRVKAAPTDAKRELYDAMLQIAETGRGPDEQLPSMGCSIKWR